LDDAPNVGFVHTTFHVIGERGELIRSNADWTGDVSDDRIQRGTDFIAGSMRSSTPVCLSSVVMRTAALPEVCFEAADEVVGDFVLFLRIALDWDIGFLRTPGIELRIHAGQLSKAFDRADNFRAWRDSKLRFISANSARLDHVGALRRSARGYAAAALSEPVAKAAGESRMAGIRALRRAVRIWPQVIFAPRMWWTAADLVIGPRALRFVRGLRA
jgi:hypothetical protein